MAFSVFARLETAGYSPLFHLQMPVGLCFRARFTGCRQLMFQRFMQSDSVRSFMALWNCFWMYCCVRPNVHYLLVIPKSSDIFSSAVHVSLARFCRTPGNSSISFPVFPNFSSRTTCRRISLSPSLPTFIVNGFHCEWPLLEKFRRFLFHSSH